MIDKVNDILMIVQTCIFALGGLWLFIGQLLKKKQERLDKTLDYKHKEQITTVINNLKHIQHTVISSYKTKSQQEILNDVRELILKDNLNSISAVHYCVYAEDLYLLLKGAK